MTAEAQNYPSPLVWKATPNGSTTTVALIGEIDLSVAAELEDCIRDAMDGGSETVIFDLGAVRFMDSTGLRALAGAKNSCEAAGRCFELGDVSMPVRRLLAVAGLDEWFGLTTAH